MKFSIRSGLAQKGKKVPVERNHPTIGALSGNWLQQMPEELHKALLRLATRKGVRLYAAGGLVRDILFGRKPADLDFVVDPDPLGCARELAAELEATLVILDEEEPVARVVWEVQIDFSGFRKEATSIDEDLREKIFYPMITTRSDGTGLGLSIAQSLINRHQGLIECSSKPGNTVFTILLPLDSKQ